jgi:hypothetical protein
MLRIALILALLAAGGALVVSQFVTKPKVDELNTTLANTQQELETTTTAKNKAESEAKVAKAAAEKAGKELADAKTARDEAAAEAQKQTTRADRLQNEFNTVSKDRNEARQQLAQWEALGVRPDQIQQLRADLRKTTEERDVLTDEQKIHLRKIDFLQAKVDKYEGKDVIVEMPGLKGNVVAVDGQWGFVVLDVGENSNAKPGGIVMVLRGDKLIGKARIVTVEPTRSIANLLPDWQQGDVAVAVNDRVIY